MKSLENKKECSQIIGYACINETLARIKPKKNAITVNRGMVKKTFEQRGLKYAGELALLNLLDMEKVIRWNYAHGIYFYRMSSDMFSWASEYRIDDLPQAKQIDQQLQKIGMLAQKFGQRLTYHPGQFNVLLSPSERVVQNTVKELEFHANVMDRMKLPRTPYAKINIHLGGAYNNKHASMKRFCSNFELLSEAVTSRLTVENDDKVSMYTVQDLYDGVYKHIRIPIVFDNLHHECNPGNLSEEDAFLLAYSTWPEDIMPVVHVSQSKQLFDSKAPRHAHSDYVTECFTTYGKKVAIMIEAKAKELAVQKYQELCC